MDQTVEMGKRLAVARRRANLSQNALGVMLGVHPATVWRWEKGERDCMRSARELAKALDVSLAWLLTGEGKIHA